MKEHVIDLFQLILNKIDYNLHFKIKNFIISYFINLPNYLFILIIFNYENNEHILSIILNLIEKKIIKKEEFFSEDISNNLELLLKLFNQTKIFKNGLYKNIKYIFETNVIIEEIRNNILNNKISIFLLNLNHLEDRLSIIFEINQINKIINQLKNNKEKIENFLKELKYIIYIYEIFYRRKYKNNIIQFNFYINNQYNIYISDY